VRARAIAIAIRNLRDNVLDGQLFTFLARSKTRMNNGNRWFLPVGTNLCWQSCAGWLPVAFII